MAPYDQSMGEALQQTPIHPIELFQEWMDLAEKSEPNDPNAAALATAGADGLPSVRMVLIKHWDANGFRFFTNANSRKGRQLAENPRAALCMHWKSLRRQVRINGPVGWLGDEKSDEYFHSRSRRSQIAAAVSHQSDVLPARPVLEEAVDLFAREYEGREVPRPSYWIGYELEPETIEFWSDGADRLHNRTLFTRRDHRWDTTLLYP